MKILSLDVATKTGWAVWHDDEITSGEVSFSLDKRDGEAQRLKDFGNYLLKEIENGVDTIVYEKAPFTAHAKATALLNEFRGVLKFICAKKRVRLVQFNVSSIKKAVTGKGNAKKPEIISIMQATYPTQNILTDNQADALALLWTASPCLNIQRPRNAGELF